MICTFSPHFKSVWSLNTSKSYAGVVAHSATLPQSNVIATHTPTIITTLVYIIRYALPTISTFLDLPDCPYQNGSINSPILPTLPPVTVSTVPQYSLHPSAIPSYRTPRQAPSHS